eukprot:gb/GECH01008362.1/.p1 GENE.gb/GECH01008362.1/~~gb/GECH01008362.1/.p1  ORF type:complete len:303 (+),score=45.36 gb/GECH01008362.1/:1-909(+)
MSLTVKLRRFHRKYYPGENVKGSIIVDTNSNLSHQGITLSVQGSVSLQLSGKNVGLFEAFYNSFKPLQMIDYTFEVQPAGKIPAGETEIPFEFPLKATGSNPLYETYHGVFINVGYTINVDMKRSMFARDLHHTTEFFVHTPGQGYNDKPHSGFPINLTPKALNNVRKSAQTKIPEFHISGKIDSAKCNIDDSFSGEIKVERTDVPIKSIELQFIRVETCITPEAVAKEPTEIQNLQLADGDVCQEFAIPIHMTFPRLFCCPTLHTRNFRVQFEMNILILFSDGNQVIENYPLILYRPKRES